MNPIDRILTTVRLAMGSHKSPGSSMCIMECEAYIAGEKHSDRPECVCPVIGAAARRINDLMTDAERNELLAPMLGQFAGTRGTLAHERHRALIAADYAVRVFAPVGLKARGRADLAAKLASCEKVVDKRTAIEANKTAAAAAAAYAAAAAAYAAAAYAAAAAAYAADDAAYAAAAYAADDATRRQLCEACVQMLRDMIAVYSTAPKEWARKPETLPCLVG